MYRTIQIATALLLVQLGLVVALQFAGTGKDQPAANVPLLGFAPEAVTSLTITGPENDRVLLQKSGNGWVLPEYFNAPASASQVSAVLARLAGLKQGIAVATTAGAGKRFKVADDLFQRHVVIKAGESVVGDLYAGTSPGFRQIHVRKAGSENVVAVELSTFELETKALQWLDKNMFTVKEEDIEALAIADLVLEKKDAAWQLAGLSEGETTDAKAAADLLAKVAGLTVQAVVDPQAAKALFGGPPALQFTITRKGGGKAEYRLAKAEGDYYVLKHSERDLYCKVHSLPVDSLQKVNRDSLISRAQTAGPEQAAEKGK
ncbi:MAG: DUF4340 domain-containing protein [Desulforhopalus sp.]|nr:DUF4340 domain-containing protein [Desulforhopalus sp.]